MLVAVACQANISFTLVWIAHCTTLGWCLFGPKAVCHRAEAISQFPTNIHDFIHRLFNDQLERDETGKQKPFDLFCDCAFALPRDVMQNHSSYAHVTKRQKLLTHTHTTLVCVFVALHSEQTEIKNFKQTHTKSVWHELWHD